MKLNLPLHKVRVVHTVRMEQTLDSILALFELLRHIRKQDLHLVQSLSASASIEYFRATKGYAAYREVLQLKLALKCEFFFI